MEELVAKKTQNDLFAIILFGKLGTSTNLPSLQTCGAKQNKSP